MTRKMLLGIKERAAERVDTKVEIPTHDAEF